MKRSSGDKKFCKTASCPSSQTLLSYRRRLLSVVDRTLIDNHLRCCDFCSAELQLLMQHRSTTEEYRLVEMPRQLRRLAEDLLSRTATPLALIALTNNRQAR